MLLEIEHLQKAYGVGPTATLAIADVHLSVNEREFICVVGPSGCGKTTLLKCISGLLTPSGGEVRVNGKVVVGPPPKMAVVFQDYGRSLFPWMTVRKNIEFPLKHKHLSKKERDTLVMESAASVGLTDAIDRYPWQLSGGMQQRAAIARALAYQPDILLMDEPFASVDAQTRSDLEDLVLRVHQEYHVTVLFVTHDIEESVYLANRVVVLSNSPTEVLEILDVDLPYPRDQIATKELPRFIEMRGHEIGRAHV